MNVDDIRNILDLVREHDLAEFELELDGVKVKVKKAGGPSVVHLPPPASYHQLSAVSLPPAAPAGAAAGPAGPAASGPDEGADLEFVKSPIVGTFYRSSEPGAAAFAEKGAMVKKGQTLCIIEAMKLLNEIESDYDGEVVTVYVENGQPVQYGERLFAIKVK